MPHSTPAAHKVLLTLSAGLGVAGVSVKPGDRLVIAERDEYSYYCYFLHAGQRIKINHLACASVFLPAAANGLAVITVNNISVPAGASASSELADLDIVAMQGSGYVLIAGSRKSAPGAKPGLITRANGGHYVVNKPWGREWWINGEHPVFSFKGIFLKEGARTSLQYHRYKTEAALLCQGIMGLVYKANGAVANDQVQHEDLGALELTAMSTVSVEPRTLHRIHGITDIHYYEISTSHLDDVVRVQDDHRRADGRIEEEHMLS